MNRVATSCVFAMIACAVAADAISAGDIAVPREILALSPEPDFDPLYYSELPSNVRMVVNLSSKDVVDAFLRKYPAAHADSIQLRLGGEYPIKSKNLYFRRISIFLADLENVGYHGACGQPIAIWLTPASTIHGIFVNEPTCPV